MLDATCSLQSTPDSSKKNLESLITKANRGIPYSYFSDYKICSCKNIFQWEHSILISTRSGSGPVDRSLDTTNMELSN
jgi:hypothetical protein